LCALTGSSTHTLVSEIFILVPPFQVSPYLQVYAQAQPAGVRCHPLLERANSETKCNAPSFHRGGDLGYSTIPPTTKPAESLMRYRQITSDERYMISKLKQHKFNQAEIAQILGRHRSTVSRELRRNCSRADGRSALEGRRAHARATVPVAAKRPVHRGRLVRDLRPPRATMPLRRHRTRTQHAPSQASGLSHTGGMLLWAMTAVALQT
jgi:predicted XRE-type DNA-binding protein